MTCYDPDGTVCETADHPFVDAAYLAGRWIFRNSLRLCAAMTLYVAVETAHTYRRCTRSR